MTKKTRKNIVIGIFVLIVLALIAFLNINYVIAEKITIGGVNKDLSDGGTYSSAFLGKGKGIYNIKWENVKSKYYTMTRR